MTKLHRKKATAMRYQLWPEFSKRIRVRDKRCLVDGHGFGVCGGVLHASHFYPKGSHPLLMLFPLNCCAMCARHHLFWWHRNPVEAWQWYVHVIPHTWRDQLECMRMNALGRKGMTEAELRAEWEAWGI